MLADTHNTIVAATALGYRVALDELFDKLVQNCISVNNGFIVDLETVKKIYSELRALSPDEIYDTYT